MLMRADPTPVRRVLMTADCVGGVWSYAMDLAGGLQSHGIHVTIALMGPRPTSDQRGEARRRAIDVVEGPYRLEWMPDPWRDVARAGEWLMSLADRCEPDIVHLNGFCHARLPWRVPVAVVAHSCVRSWWRGVHGCSAPPEWDEYTARVTEGLKAADVVIAPTRALLEEIQDEYGEVTRTRVIPNGSSALGGVPEPPAREPVVFSAGRLWDEAKNIGALCCAASDLSWRTFIAGDVKGPAGAFTASGAVCCLGRLDAGELAKWYRRAGIYALPARYEPFGLSVVEAAAAGCALVLGDIRTLREVWSGAAVFVPPDNRRALVRSIEGLIHDDQQRGALAALARERAARFTVPAMTGGYIDTYNDLLVPAAAA
jgi:glycosyltransferase involved in cell wall biosynthesis